MERTCLYLSLSGELSVANHLESLTPPSMRLAYDRQSQNRGSGWTWAIEVCIGIDA
jgi:hypothetical protein